MLQNDDYITATNYGDYIYAHTVNDEVFGNGGNDIILGGDGNDTLSGGSGNDIINGGLGNDIIQDGKGNDKIDGDIGNDTIYFSGNFNEYFLNLDSSTGVITIADTNSSRDGSNYLTKIESFNFKDRTYSLSDILTKTGFNSLDYIASYGDLINAYGTNTTYAVDHYVNNGQSESRVPDAFNAWGYLAKY